MTNLIFTSFKTNMSIISKDCDRVGPDRTYFCRAKCVPSKIYNLKFLFLISQIMSKNSNHFLEWNFDVGSCPQKKDPHLVPSSWSYYRYNEDNLLSKQILDFPGAIGKHCAMFCRYNENCTHWSWSTRCLILKIFKTAPSQA